MFRCEPEDQVLRLMKVILIIVCVLGGVVLLGWAFWRAGVPDRLVAEAMRGEIAGSEPALRSHHEAVIGKVAERLPELGPDEHRARRGLVRLLAGARYRQLQDLTGDRAPITQLTTDLHDPDPRIVDALVLAYRDEARAVSGLDEAVAYERLLSLAMAAESDTDFLTREAFCRRAWAEVGETARVPLTQLMGDLISMARSPVEDVGDEYSGWDQVDAEERRRRHDGMLEVLDEWVVPTLVAAAGGEGIPERDRGGVLHKARAYGLPVGDF